MHIRPVDVPDLTKDAIAECMAVGSSSYQASAVQLGHDNPEAAGRSMASIQARSLAKAEYFHVAEPMMELAKVAARTLDEAVLYREDLPARDGFAYFASPLPAYLANDGVGDKFDVVAASWTEVPALDALMITWYISRESSYQVVDNGGWEAAHPSSRVVQYLCNLWLLGKAGHGVYMVGGEPRPLTEDFFGSNIGVLFSVWHIMKQALASVTRAHYDRASRRRFTKRNEEPPEVRVITLRRASPESEKDNDREWDYHHRWIVRGHWRRQWYPSQQAHRPVWIAPHIKGPEDAPLLGGEKVYALRR